MRYVRGLHVLKIRLTAVGHWKQKSTSNILRIYLVMQKTLTFYKVYIYETLSAKYCVEYSDQRYDLRV